MSSSAKHYLHQAGNKFFGPIQNGEHGIQIMGNISGNITIGENRGKTLEERLAQCCEALHFGCSDPYDDRDKIVAVKATRGRLITASCEWILSHPMYKMWENTRTRSQLLWISSAAERGKTMMAIYLSKQLEKLVAEGTATTVLYFFIDRQDKRDTAVHVLRGLLTRFTKTRADLAKHLLDEYQRQKGQLFEANSIEALWRVFMNMVSDPKAGQVYCIIDGLDYCSDDSLRRLISRITNFYLDEPQAVVDDNVNAGQNGPGPSSAFASPYNQTNAYPQEASSSAFASPYSQASPYPQASTSSVPVAPYSQASPFPPASASSTSAAQYSQTSPYPQATPYGPSSTQARSSQRRGVGLKMILVSREKPEWMVDQLSDFPRIDVGARGKKYGSASASAPRTAKRAPTLADVAASVMGRQAQGRQSSVSAISQVSPAVPQSLSPYTPSLPNQSSALVSVQTPFSPAQSLALSHHPLPGSPVTSQPPGHTAALTPVQTPFSQTPNASSNQQSPLGYPNTLALSAPQTSFSPANIFSPQEQITGPATPGSHIQTQVPSVHPSSSGRVSGTSMVTSTGPVPHIASAASGPSMEPLGQQLSSSRPSQEQPASPETQHGTGPTIPPLATILQEAQYTEEPPEYIQEEGHASYGADKKNEHENVDEDVGDHALRLYIEAKLEELAAERQYSTELQSYIIAALEYRGDETFLWVDFAIEEIRKSDLNGIETVLNSLPLTLTEMYSYILLNVAPGLVDLVVGLLRWTVCSRRPMNLHELTVALNLSNYHINDARNLVMNAVYACGNMFTISSEDQTVNIVHNSLVDYLSGESSPILLDPRLSKFAVRPQQVNGDIANFCISYLEAGCCNGSSISLQGNAVEYNQRVARFPFMAYAASFWPDHLREAVNPYLNLSSPFFQPKSEMRKNWWHTYWAFSTGKSTIWAPRNFTLLHIAAYFDLVSIAQQMQLRGELHSRLESKDTHGYTPLNHTVVRGHKAMFTFLTYAGARHEETATGDTLLELACEKGQREIAALLIDMGYNVNKVSPSKSPKATMYLITRYLPGLISEGLDLNRDIWSMIFRDIGDQWPILVQSAAYGHKPVMELLLSRGALIEGATTRGFTSMHAAAYTGQIECVRLLLDHGAKDQPLTASNWLPLHFAAMRGKLSVVELLLDRGVPIDSLTIKSKSALHFAAYSGHAAVVQTLVEHGASLELQSHKGETPLHLATRHGKPQVVELLLSFGASRSAVTNEGKTALDMVQGSTTIVGKECLRILQTFGMEGYQPWTPPPDPNAAKTAEGAAAGAASAGTEPSQARKQSMAAGHVKFSPAVAPRTVPLHGIEANISFYGQLQPNPPTGPTQYGAFPPPQPFQPFQPFQLMAQPPFSRAQSEPVQSHPRFTYNAQATLNQQGSQYNQPFDPMSSGSEPPPPYAPPAPGSNVYVPSNFPEKSPAFTTSSASGPTLNPGQALSMQSPSVQPTTPIPLMSPQITTTAPVPETQRPAQSSMIQMMNALSMSSTTPSPSQAPPSPNIQFSQPSPSHCPPAMQAPISPAMAPPQPATAPAATPWHPPASPVQPMQPYQTPAATGDYPQNLASNTNLQMQMKPTQSLTPTTPQLYQNQQPVQSPQFSGSSTASTYNSSFEYSAPPVVAPYNPNMGQPGGPSGAPWQTQPSGPGLLFAPPPTTAVVAKRKSFLGGFMGN